ncbi:putative alcohol dehydrogenase [Phaeomoniella chlamydospora]|uniref:Putative alcohol dehydrogenase n=1 Tax=Phaeomoniella chlamydospora TaxID=158046 RepID=A0A0G2H8Q6_PHACM|nr:putative alcohol dehydrogenase [Phaeomoniella chlamydospora]
MAPAKALVCLPKDGKNNLSPEDVEIPKLKSNEALVRTKAIAQIPVDIQSFDSNRFGEGAVLECDFAGTVQEVGDSVKRLKVGDEIAACTSREIFDFSVATICFPYNFDVAKSMGAKHVFDYHSSTVVEDIKKALPNLQYVFDTVGDESSSVTSSKAIRAQGGVFCTVRPTGDYCKEINSRVKVTPVLVFTAFLKPHQHKTAKWPASEEDHSLSAELFDSLLQWLQDGAVKPNKPKLMGGLDKVPEGFQLYRDNRFYMDETMNFQEAIVDSDSRSISSDVPLSPTYCVPPPNSPCSNIAMDLQEISDVNKNPKHDEPDDTQAQGVAISEPESTVRSQVSEMRDHRESSSPCLMVTIPIQRFKRSMTPSPSPLETKPQRKRQKRSQVVPPALLQQPPSNSIPSTTPPHLYHIYHIAQLHESKKQLFHDEHKSPVTGPKAKRRPKHGLQEYHVSRVPEFVGPTYQEEFVRRRLIELEEQLEWLRGMAGFEEVWWREVVKPLAGWTGVRLEEAKDGQIEEKTLVQTKHQVFENDQDVNERVTNEIRREHDHEKGETIDAFETTRNYDYEHYQAPRQITKENPENTNGPEPNFEVDDTLLSTYDTYDLNDPNTRRDNLQTYHSPSIVYSAQQTSPYSTEVALKRCIHCKRNKKGCDRTLPQCGRCSKSGRECIYPTSSKVGGGHSHAV